MCVNINNACIVLCSQSLCEVVVRGCCRELKSKSLVVLPFWNLLLSLPYRELQMDKSSRKLLLY